jgi:hypothetical protein
MTPIDRAVAFFRLRAFFNPRRLEMLWWLYLVSWFVELIANVYPMFAYQHTGGLMGWLVFLLAPLYLLVRLAVARLFMEVALVLLAEPREFFEADGRVVDAAGQDWDESWGHTGKS